MINTYILWYKCKGNNPMVGATVACAVAVEEALKAWKYAVCGDSGI